MAPPSASQPIAIVGTGRVARALGRLLYEEGEPVMYVTGRNIEHARAAAEFIGPGVKAVSIAEAAKEGTRFLIAVSDSAVQRVAETLAAEVRQAPAPAPTSEAERHCAGRDACPARKAASGIALHTCGARGGEVLEALERAGFSCGTLHPLQTISDSLQSSTLRGAPFAVSGDERAVSWAEDIARRLGSGVLHVKPGGRAIYHAAAVMASNYVAAVIGAAQELMVAASGEQPDVCLRALEPLVRASVTNAFACGPVGALTGPVERGDAGTVRLHLAALRGAPVILSLYRAAGLETLEMARRKGLEPEKAADIEAALRSKEV